MLFEVTNIASSVPLGGATVETGSASGNGNFSPEQSALGPPNAHSAAPGTDKNYDTGKLGMLATTSLNTTGRHTDGANYLLSDGHVKWLKGAVVSPGYNAATSTDYQNKTNYYAVGTAGPFANGGTLYPAATFSAI